MATILRTIARTFARTIAHPVSEPVALPALAIGRMAVGRTVPAAEQARSRAAEHTIAATALAARLCSETGRHQYGCAHRPERAPWDTTPLTLTEAARLRSARRRSAVAALTR
jgi:hypothetical protein